MTVPLLILSVFALGLGALARGSLLDKLPGNAAEHETIVIAVSIAVALGGIALGFLIYRGRARLAKRRIRWRSSRLNASFGLMRFTRPPLAGFGRCSLSSVSNSTRCCYLSATLPWKSLPESAPVLPSGATAS